MRIHFANLNLPRRSAKRLQRMQDSQLVELAYPPLSLGQLQDVTAFVLGYRDWQELRKSLGQAPASPADEDGVPDAERLKRYEYQGARMAEKLGIDVIGATRIVIDWQPSSAKATLTPPEEKDDVESFDGDDSMDDLRLMHPADPQFARDVFRVLGWRVLHEAMGEYDASLPFFLVDAPRLGKPIPVFLSGLAYMPGDTDDAQAKLQRTAVEQEMGQYIGVPGVVMMYSHPMERDGQLFLGSIWRRGKWQDMPWSQALKSVEDLLAWADKGWTLDADRPETRDTNGELLGAVANAMRAREKRSFGG